MNMHGFALYLTPSPVNLVSSHPRSANFPRLLLYPITPTCRITTCYQPKFSLFVVNSLPNYYYNQTQKRRRSCNSNFRRRRTVVKASGREAPHQVLGVSPSATPDEIKRAYRKLALKYHPDVNKEANAQQKFMRIKHAYNTLLNSESRRKYDSGNQGSDYSHSAARGNQRAQDEEEFYGFGNFLTDVQITIEDFFKDLQDEFRNWEATAASQAKPKSLWEELAEIGEEFVEFLEKELNITDTDTETEYNNEEPLNRSPYGARTRSDSQSKADGGNSIEENFDEIEAALAQLKKELGL